jgi:membrane protein implicated in regulation of membrane protease activity
MDLTGNKKLLSEVRTGVVEKPLKGKKFRVKIDGITVTAKNGIKEQVPSIGSTVIVNLVRKRYYIVGIVESTAGSSTMEVRRDG